MSSSPSPPSGGEGRGEGGVRIASKPDQDGSKHPFEIAHDIGIREADDAIAHLLEREGAAPILDFAIGVGVAVKLDYQPLGSGSEVGDVGREHNLPLKFNTQPIAPNCVPQSPLGLGLVRAKLLRARPCLDVSFHAAPSPNPLPLKGVRAFDRHAPMSSQESLSVNA